MMRKLLREDNVDTGKKPRPGHVSTLNYKDNEQADNQMVMRVIIKRLLTIKEASAYLGISERQLEYLCYDGQVKQTKLPNTKKRLYDIMDLDEFVNRSKRA